MAKTVEQVAVALEISITTVRPVLGGKAEQYRISAKTQQRINDYIAENGLVVNHIARSLKLNKTETLGLVIPRLSTCFLHHGGKARSLLPSGGVSANDCLHLQRQRA